MLQKILKSSLFLIISLGLLVFTPQIVFAQVACETTAYCCAIRPADFSTDTNNCGYAILKSGGGGFLCEKQVPQECVRQDCDPTKPPYDALNCHAIPGAARYATPSATLAPTATSSAVVDRAPQCGQGIALEDCLTGAQNHRAGGIFTDYSFQIIFLIAGIIYLLFA